MPNNDPSTHECDEPCQCIIASSVIPLSPHAANGWRLDARKGVWEWWCPRCGKTDPRVARECEDAKVAIAVARSNNQGCTIIVLAIVALLAWVAYLVFQFPPAQ